MNIRRCDGCGYESLTCIEIDYPHRNCFGLMKLIGIEIAEMREGKK